MQVRLYAAGMAAAAGDLPVAQHLALSLVKAGHAPAWRLAARLATGRGAAAEEADGELAAADAGGRGALLAVAAAAPEGQQVQPLPVVEDLHARMELLAFALRLCSVQQLGSLSDALAGCQAGLAPPGPSAPSDVNSGAPAGSAADKAVHVEEAIRAANSPGGTLTAPSLGQPHLLLAALLGGSEEGRSALWAALEEGTCQEGGSYARLQRLLAVGIAAAALQALQGAPAEALAAAAGASASSAPGSKSAAAGEGGRAQQGQRHASQQALLALPVARLLEALQQQQRSSGAPTTPATSAAPSEGPASAAASAAERAARYQRRLADAGEARELRRWLPNMEAGRFVSGGWGCGGRV